MKKYPRISIVTTNYNQDKYLEETILSVLNQNYPNLEYIIIDAGSTDGSLDIIKKYQNQLTYWESSPDKGMYDGLQKGLSKTTGDIMAWINSDDMYLPKSFFSVAEIFSSFQEVNWLLGFPTIYDSIGRIVECPHTFRQWSKYDVFIGNYRWIQQESVFWRRSLWERVGGKLNINLKYAGDFDLWFRFFQYEKLYVTTALLSGFRMREDQLSVKQRVSYEKEIQNVITSYKLTLEEKVIIKKYNIVFLLVSFLLKFRILNANSILTKFKLNNFAYPPIIRFNREQQKYEL